MFRIHGVQRVSVVHLVPATFIGPIWLPNIEPPDTHFPMDDTLNFSVSSSTRVFVATTGFIIKWWSPKHIRRNRSKWRTWKSKWLGVYLYLWPHSLPEDQRNPIPWVEELRNHAFVYTVPTHQLPCTHVDDRDEGFRKDKETWIARRIFLMNSICYPIPKDNWINSWMKNYFVLLSIMLPNKTDPFWI